MAESGTTPNNPLYSYIVGSEKTDWARDSTLSELVEKADATNTILSEYVKKKFPDLEQKIIDAQNKASKSLDRGLDDATEAAEKTGDAVKDLEAEFKRQKTEAKFEWDRRIGAITNVIKSADPAEAAKLIGTGLEKSGGYIGEKLGGALGKSKFAKIVGSLVGSAAGAAIAAALSRSLEISKAFTEMYDTGLTFNGSMVKMAETAAETGQTIEQMQSQMTKFSSTAAAVGSTRLAQFGKSLLNATNQGADFAMSTEQMRESAYSYLEMQLQSGQGLAQTQEDLITGSKTYLDNLTGLSVLTGKSRKDEEAKLKAKMAEAKTKAAMMMLSPADKKLLQERLTQVPEAARDYVRAAFVELKTGMPVITQEMRQATMLGLDPGLLEDFQSKLVSSTTSAAEFDASATDLFTNINEQAAVFTLVNNRLQGTAESLFNMNGEFLTQAEIIRKGRERGLTRDEALAEAIDKAKPEEKTKTFLETTSTLAQSMATLKSTIDSKMIDGVTTATQAMKDFGDKLNDLIRGMGSEPKLTGVERGLEVVGGIATAGYVAQGLSSLRAKLPTTTPKVPTVPEPTVPGPKVPTPGTTVPKAGLAGRMAGAARLAKSATGLGLLGVAGEYGGEYLEEAGHEKLGAAAKIGGYTATGAALGSIVPFVGTGLGAAAGAGYGVYQNWENLFGKKAEPVKPTEAKPTIPVPEAKSTATVQSTLTNIIDESKNISETVKQMSIVSSSLLEILNVNRMHLDTTSNINSVLKGEISNSLSVILANLNERSVSDVEQTKSEINLTSVADLLIPNLSMLHKAIQSTNSKINSEESLNEIQNLFSDYRELIKSTTYDARNFTKEKPIPYAEIADYYNSIGTRITSGVKESSQRAFESFMPDAASLIQSKQIESVERTPNVEPVTATPSPLQEAEQRRTRVFHNQSIMASDNMIAILKEMLLKLEELNQNVVDQTNELDRSINSINPTLF